MKKYLNELSSEELKMVVGKNKKLQYEIIDDLQEQEMDYISDILDCFRKSLSDWSIGFNNQYNYIKVKDYRLFLDGLSDTQANYGFLADEFNPMINEIQNKYITLDNITNIDKFDQLEEEIEKEIDNLINEVIEQFNKMTNYNYDNDIYDYFIDFYIDERIDSSRLYIDNDFILYEDVSYTKSYN